MSSRGRRREARGVSARRVCAPSWEPVSGFAAIVQDYRETHAGNAAWELSIFAAQRSLKAAIRLAGLASTGHKRFAHQYRIPRRVLAEAEQCLQRERPRLARARTFDELHTRVRDAIGDVRGIGPLMVYDTAVRIGAFRGLAPQRVYLHSGARVGARALGLDARPESLAVRQLPGALRHVTAAEAEDILCIYKRQLAALGRNNRS